MKGTNLTGLVASRWGSGPEVKKQNREINICTKTFFTFYLWFSCSHRDQTWTNDRVLIRKTATKPINKPPPPAAPANQLHSQPVQNEVSVSKLRCVRKWKPVYFSYSLRRCRWTRDSSQWLKALWTHPPSRCTHHLKFKNKTEKQHKQVELLNPDTKLTWEQRGGAAPLVLRRVLQLLVLGRSWGEDGGHSQQDGGSVGVTHLVDHDGGQSNTKQLGGGTQEGELALRVSC